MTVLSNEDKGWMAGILDFQGHICDKANKQRATPQLVLYVETRIQEIPRRLGELTGTSGDAVKTHGPAPGEKEREEIIRRGCAEHCPEAHVHVLNTFDQMPPMKKWTITGAGLAVVLHTIRPVLITTREPWDWALGTTLANARLSGQGAARAVGTIRRLHQLGWTVPTVFEGVLGEEDSQKASA
jgi:hypothetical protein